MVLQLVDLILVKVTKIWYDTVEWTTHYPKDYPDINGNLVLQRILVEKCILVDRYVLIV